MEIEALKHFPVQLEVPVAWGEMDAFQHVNNLVYMRWFESARMAYMERCQALALMQHTGSGPILRNTSVRYRIPLTWPDTVISATRVTEMGVDRCTMQHRVYSMNHGAIAAEGEAVIVYVNYSKNQKARIPDSIRDFILSTEAETPRLLD